MVELRLFGTISLTRGAQDMEALTRRSKRVALLAYLALAQPRGFHRRDKLHALFWPEADTAHARAALNQALYVIRSALGDDALEARGQAEIRLRQEMVWCDVRAFEEALDAGHFSDALALFRGDFLEAFYISGSPVFDRWCEDERVRLRQRASHGAWRLADEAVQRRDVGDAQRWAEQAYALGRADEASLQRLMLLLMELGLTDAALRAHDLYARQLRDELGIDPSARVQALVQRIHDSQSATISPRPTGPGAEGPPVTSDSHTPATRPARSPGGALRWLARFGAPALLAGIVVALLVARKDARPSPTRDVPPRILVRAFDVSLPDSVRHVGAAMASEISGLLTHIAGLRVLSRMDDRGMSTRTRQGARVPNAIGATHVLEGWIGEYDDDARRRSFRLVVRLIGADHGEIIWSRQMTVRSTATEVMQTQRDIAERIARALGVAMTGSERRAFAHRPTNDLDAYLFYLRGLEYYRRSFNESDTRLAGAMFERAVLADSMFALAWARLASTHAQTYWFHYDRTAHREMLARRALQRALALNADHPDVQIAAANYHYWCHLSFDRALAALTSAQRARPHDSEVFEARGNVLRRKGDFGGALESFTTALELEPSSARVLSLVAATSALTGERRNAETYFERLEALHPEFALPYYNHARFHLSVDGDVAEARRVLESAHAPEDDHALLLLRHAVDMFAGSYDQVLRRLRTAAPTVFETQWQFVPSDLLMAQLLEAMGRSDLARAHYTRALAVVNAHIRARPTEGHYFSALAIAYAGLGRRGEAVAAAQRGVELMPVSADAWRGLYRLEDLARVYTMIGDSAAALTTLERVERSPGGPTVAFLSLDPVWRPLRASERFRMLMHGRRTATRRM